jgi:hypothetical protein
MTFTPTAFARWEPSERYPDPSVQVLDPAFNKYRLGLAGVERIATGPVSDIDIAVVDSLKVLDLKRPTRETDIDPSSRNVGYRACLAGRP